MRETEYVELVVAGEKIRLRKADVLDAVRDGPLGAVRQHAVENSLARALNLHRPLARSAAVKDEAGRAR